MKIINLSDRYFPFRTVLGQSLSSMQTPFFSPFPRCIDLYETCLRCSARRRNRLLYNCGSGGRSEMEDGVEDHRLREVFQALDKDANGTVEPHEMQVRQAGFRVRWRQRVACPPPCVPSALLALPSRERLERFS